MLRSIYPGCENHLRILMQNKVGTYLSDETKQKILQYLTRRHLSEETKEKFSSTRKGLLNTNNYGRLFSEESKSKMSHVTKERPCSEKMRKKLSLSVRRTGGYKKKKVNQEKYYQANREKILICIKKHRKDNWKHYKDYYHKMRLKKIDAVFKLFGNSVDSLNKIGGSIRFI